MSKFQLFGLLASGAEPVAVTGTVYGERTTIYGYLRGIRREDGSGRSFLVDLLSAGPRPIPVTVYVRTVD